ncbi:TonB-dependent receptor [Parapedobacter tibetensis]|uniref:TonB-dependent receptor n=1 Tax=Parapedobacter tibetensis TaxID=2972951 RepID=UPI00214D7990|nr:TonB-dependent receptor [Parapedobacter tibetensis]
MSTIITSSLFILLCMASSVGLAQPSTQTVRGNIRDEASRIPLVGVTVRLLDGDSQIITASDALGNFRLTDVPLGRQTFLATHQGYQPETFHHIIITAGREVVLNLMLTESVTSLEEVIVNYGRREDSRFTNSDMAAVSARPFSMEETKRYAGSLGDPARMTANFAGVVSTNDTRNDIIIRGNSPNAMLWQLEGLNIPNPNHFGALNSMGGSVSMLNNNNLDKSDFMTSAFPAQYGNALGGVFDLRLRDGNNQKHEFLAQMGFNGFEGGAEGPLGRTNRATYLVNVRYSTLAAFQQLGLNFGAGGATPEYMDINYKISAPVGKRGVFSVFGIWGESLFTSLGSEYDPDGQAYGNDYSNRFARYNTNISGLRYEHQLGNNTTASLVLGYSRTNERFDRDSVSTEDPAVFTPNWQWRFVTDKYSGVLTLHHKFSGKHNMVAGVVTDFTNYSLFNKRIYDGMVDRVFSDREGWLNLTQTYLQWRYRMTDRLTMMSGLHHQYLDLSNSQSLEPRMGLRYRVNHAHAIGLGYGLHSQMDNLLTYATITRTPTGNVYTNESLGLGRSHHAVLSHDWGLSSNTYLKTEVYYQWLFDIPVERHPSSFSTINLGAESIPTLRDNLVNEGTGRNYGLEFTLERSFDRGFYYLVTASIFDSQYRGSDGVWRNTAFNMRNVLNVLAGREWKLGRDVFGAGATISWVGGRYLSPIDYEASAVDGEVQYAEAAAFSLRQRDYFRTDVKLSFRREYRRATLEVALDLQNITNNENIFRQEWNARQLRVVDNLQQGFFPVPFIRFTF